jgi:hypothetical protein
MHSNVRIHAAAAASLLVLVSIITLFWLYPKLLVFVLLAVVAALAYGALYLILAAWMDPQDRTHADATAPAEAETGLEAAAPDVSPRPREEADPTEDAGQTNSGRKTTP